MLSTNCCNLAVSDVFVTSIKLSQELSLLPGRGKRALKKRGSRLKSMSTIFCGVLRKGVKLPEEILLGGDWGNNGNAGKVRSPVAIEIGPDIGEFLLERFSGWSGSGLTCGLSLPIFSSLLYFESMLQSSYGEVE